jgi:hypothetical protein
VAEAEARGWAGGGWVVHGGRGQGVAEAPGGWADGERRTPLRSEQKWGCERERATTWG